MGVRPDVYIREFECPADPAASALVLCMTRAFDPQQLPEWRSADREERIRLTELRASCIRAGRKEFGKRFYGGFRVDPFSMREYGDCLLPSVKAGARREYLARVKAASICVATTGLHGSTGGKLAEYVAASRAVVSEPLHYQVPGTFALDRNYLEFRTVDEFVLSIERLLRDASLRQRMMQANGSYYRQHVRPDALVLNSLLRIIECE